MQLTRKCIFLAHLSSLLVVALRCPFRTNRDTLSAGGVVRGVSTKFEGNGRHSWTAFLRRLWDTNDEQRVWNFERLIQLESNWSEAQPWNVKLEKVWDEIVSSPNIPNQYPSLLEFFFRLTLMGDDFTRLRLPLTFRPYANTHKVLHSGASFGRILLRWTDSEFRAAHSGLFSEPIIEGIMSASGGTPFIGNQSAAFGWGFKFFRSGVQPATVLTLNAFLGRGANWNIFGYMTCNHASIAEMAGLIPTLIGWSRFPNQNGLSNMALYGLNGTQYEVPHFPYSLCFLPNPMIRDRIGTPPTLSSLSAIHNQLQLVDVGERLFDIIAIFHPRVLQEPSLLLLPEFARHVGEVYSRSQFRRSQFADSRLFFQHQPFDDDLIIRQDWIPYMTLRNMVKEGATAVYRSFFAPPKPNMLDQIIAIRSLTRAVIRIFSDPGGDAYNVIGLKGQPSFLKLLRMYIKQGGSTGVLIALNKKFKKSDAAAPSSPTKNFTTSLMSTTTTAEILDNDCIDCVGGMQNEAVVIQDVVDTFVNSIMTKNTTTELLLLGSSSSQFGKDNSKYLLTQNEWPPIASSLDDKQLEDPFLQRLVQYRQIVNAVSHIYVTNTKDIYKKHHTALNFLLPSNLTRWWTDLKASMILIPTFGNLLPSLSVFLRPIYRVKQHFFTPNPNSTTNKNRTLENNNNYNLSSVPPFTRILYSLCLSLRRFGFDSRLLLIHFVEPVFWNLKTFIPIDEDFEKLVFNIIGIGSNSN